MLRAALVGPGRWGRHLVAAVAGSEKIGFVATVGRRDDYAAALADPAIDAVVLATPHRLHAEQIVAAARAGKHVFCEKPFALAYAGARDALRACGEAGVTLAVGYNWRFQPALQEIRRMLLDGRLGKLLHLEGNFCGPSAYRYEAGHWRQNPAEAPAGGMTGRGVHLVDTMLFLAGSIDTVHARSRRLVQDFGVDDTTAMLFDFRSGATGYLGTVIATAESWRLQVFGSKGWAEVGGIEHLGTWPLAFCSVDSTPGRLEFPPLSTERAELEHFADAAMARRALAGDAELHAVAVFEAILESAGRGATVRVLQ